MEMGKEHGMKTMNKDDIKNKGTKNQSFISL
jgi:hypothetical protein